MSEKPSPAPPPSPALAGEGRGEGSAPSPAKPGEGWGEGNGREGSCSCGTVRYRIALPPIWVAHCHCSMCRRAQGAAFVTWVGAAESSFALLTGTDQLKRFQSSAAAVRTFCSNCGTPLFFQSTRWPGQIHVTLASLESSDGLEPQAHVHWSSRAPWADWSGHELPKLEPEGQPDRD